MQTLIPFVSVLAVASAGILNAVPVFYVAQPLPLYNQAQNTLTGEYAYSYAGGPSAKEEIKTIDGVTRGAYSYIDAHGIVQSAQYVADHDGFRVLATNIPTDAQVGVNVPLETPEVQAAKAAHFAEHAKAIAALGRKKRSLVHAQLPSSYSSSQYHDQTHESIKIEAPVYQHLTYAAAPVALRTVASVPTAVSHQSRHQVHNSHKIEVSTPLHPVHVVETVPAIAAYNAIEVSAPLEPVAVVSVPTAVSHQSRFQIHNDQKIQIHEPVLTEVVPVSPVIVESAPVVAVSSAVPITPVASVSHEADSVVVDAFKSAPVVASVPTSVSSQSRTQVHSSSSSTSSSSRTVKVEAPTYYHEAPALYSAPVLASYGYPTVLKSAPVAVATSVSSQSKSQVHSSKSVEVTGPVYGSAARLAYYPQLPRDTPEVAAAKQAHAEAYAAELVKHQGW